MTILDKKITKIGNSEGPENSRNFPDFFWGVLKIGPRDLKKGNAFSENTFKPPTRGGGKYAPLN